jgi:uncharacterized protein YgbK (DUF1537 family)
VHVILLGPELLVVRDPVDDVVLDVDVGAEVDVLDVVRAAAGLASSLVSAAAGRATAAAATRPPTRRADVAAGSRSRPRRA